MKFVDTAFVIAWVNKDDALHTKAIELLNVHKDSSWLTTDCILLEIWKFPGAEFSLGSRCNN